MNEYYNQPEKPVIQMGHRYKPQINKIFDSKIETLFVKHIDLFVDDLIDQWRYFGSNAETIAVTRLSGAGVL